MAQQAQVRTLPQPHAAGATSTGVGTASADRLGAAARYLGVAAALAVPAMLYMALIYAPTERTQGHAQRIFYLHIGSIAATYIAFFVTFVASILYLWRRSERWDHLARSSAEVGLLFCTLLLIAGSIWGKTIWGTWWTWDARLTTTLILWFIYAGYLMLRAYGGETAQIARSAAVVGIIGFFDIPIINRAVIWWRTLHPQPVVERSDPQLPASMIQAMFVAMLAFTILYAYLLIQRLRVEQLAVRVGELCERIVFLDDDAARTED